MGQASSDLFRFGRQKSYESPGLKESGKFEDICSDCPVLRVQLAALGATTPSCVYGKRLHVGAQADLSHGLLSVGGEPLTEALTAIEMGTIVHHTRTGGLDVPVFDRDGTRYDFKCVQAEDMGFYRLVAASESEFERFMVDNNVVCDSTELAKEQRRFMEVWAFRSPALRNGRKPVDGHHRDGALGMVILFSDPGTEGLGDDNRSILHLLRHCLKVPEGYELNQFI